jgi:hypothetical protein
MESFISILMKEAPVLKVLTALVAIRHSRRAWALKGQPLKNRISHSETSVAVGRSVCFVPTVAC